MRILKLLGIAVGGFIGLFIIFWIIETFFGSDTSSRISGDVGNLVTIFVAIAVVALVVRFFRKKKDNK